MRCAKCQGHPSFVSNLLSNALSILHYDMQNPKEILQYFTFVCRMPLAFCNAVCKMPRASSIFCIFLTDALDILQGDMQNAKGILHFFIFFWRMPLAFCNAMCKMPGASLIFFAFFCECPWYFAIRCAKCQGHPSIFYLFLTNALSILQSDVQNARGVPHFVRIFLRMPLVFCNTVCKMPRASFIFCIFFDECP